MVSRCLSRQTGIFNRKERRRRSLRALLASLPKLERIRTWITRVSV